MDSHLHSFIRKLRALCDEYEALAQQRPAPLADARDTYGAWASARGAFGGGVLSVIGDHIAKEFNVSFAVLRAKSCREEFLFARHLFYYFSRELTPLSCTAIARFSARDHATILHGARAIRNMIQTDQKFANRVSRLRAELRPLIEAYEDSILEPPSHATSTSARSVSSVPSVVKTPNLLAA